MASTISDMQKIVVTLSEPDVVIEPGSVSQLVVTMLNRQDTPDRFSLEVEGIDVEWYAIPVPAVNVAPGAETTARILFKIARNSENRAGSYPFLVRVQAMETGEIGVAQATLVIKAFSALQMELNPKRAVATFLHPLNDFDVTLANLGNTEETLDLYASDPEEGCAYEFDTERITLKPGQSETVPLAVRPKVSSVLGGMRLYGFTASARAVDDSYVSAGAHGQLEKRALISPLLGIFLLLLAFGGAGWYMLRPRPLPPTVINVFDATPKQIEAGQSVTLSWDVAPPNSQIIIMQKEGSGGTNVYDPGEQRSVIGSAVVTPKPQASPFTRPTTFYFTLIARGQGRQKEIHKVVVVTVKPPPPAPKPTIKFFTADPLKVHAGETVMLSWETHNATEIILDPGNYKVSPFEQTRQVTPDQDTTYKLRALGASSDLHPATKSVSVQVVGKGVPIAEITSFTARKTVYIGENARLRWKSGYAKTAHLDSDRGLSVDVTVPSGYYDVPVNEPTQFTLTVTDSAGNPTTKTITITPQPKPVAPAPPPITAPADTNPVPPTGGAGTMPPSGGGTAPPP